MLTITRTLIALRTDRRAVTAVEYAMIAALIAAGCVGIVGTLGTHISLIFTNLAASI